jgi:hypothetical protein
LSSNFARVATSANLISLVENLESKDDRCSSIFSSVSTSSLKFFSSRLMSLMLTQLMRSTGNLVDLWGLPRSSCQADFTIQDNDDNNNNIINPFVDDEELVVINVDAAEPTDIVEDEGTLYLIGAEQKRHQQHIKQSQD